MTLPDLESPRIRNAVHRILAPRGAIAHYLWESIPFYGHHLDELRLRPDMRVLDVGCGVGRTTLELAHRCPEGQVIGIDINPALVASAEQLAELFQLGENTQFFASDIVEKGTLPKDDTYDLIYIRHVINEVKQPGLRELARHLAQDGLLVILEPDFSMCRAFGLPHFDKHLHREGEIAREAGLSGGNLRQLLREARLDVTRFEPHLQIITEEDAKWITFAKKRLAAVYEEEIPKIESLRFRRGSQWVDERINRLRNQHTELDKLTRRHRFTHLYIQFLAHATK